MIELLIFIGIVAALVLVHFGVAVAYKIETRSKKSIWRIMDEDI